MSNRHKPPTFHDQGEQHLRDEALRVAKATQTPGQTKEQTKVIAAGIEKGIAHYKQQQKEKARERDKARKRALKLARAVPSENLAEDEDNEGEVGSTSSRLALMAAASLFLLASLVHAVRWIWGLDFTIGGWLVPPAVSALAALAFAGLAAWMVRCARRIG